MRRLVLYILIGCGSAWAGDGEVLRAKVDMPVIQELMGGCSLVCALPWEATLGETARKVTAIHDDNAETAWTEVRPGDKLTIRFLKDLPRELNGTPFYGIDFADGRIYPTEDFKAYGRVKSVRLWRNGKALYVIQLSDNPRWQRVSFPDVPLNVDDTLGVEVLEVYPGTKFPTAAITEMVLQGAH